MLTFNDIIGMKGKSKICMLTAYNYSMAKILDSINIDAILVGDSGVMVELGKDSTKNATLQEMFIFTEAVSRGAKDTLIIADMPIGTYDEPKQAVFNAVEFIKRGAHAVKVEGTCFEVIKGLINEDIPVMAHLGLLPQIASEYKVVRDPMLIQNAKEIEKAGAFSLILECIPADLANQITESISIPTIGIGAGINCDGQILVTNDLLGMYELKTKFVRKYFEYNKEVSKSLNKFVSDVKEKKFPSEKESYIWNEI